MITSTHNERVKYIRSLARRRTRQREGRFVVEGTRLLEDMVRAGIQPALAFYTASWAASTSAQQLLPSLDSAEDGCWLVSDAVLAACSETQAPQGVLAVVAIQDKQPNPGLILVLDQMRDPGNLGTILRSAEAAGAGQVLLSPGTVDLYNPKVVRGAMGAHFRLPVASLTWPAIAMRLARRRVWLADSAGATTYDVVDWTEPSALIVGGEASGAGAEAAGLARGRISIPMASDVESLNAAMAATTILFEAARQRRDRSKRENP